MNTKLLTKTFIETVLCVAFCLVGLAVGVGLVFGLTALGSLIGDFPVWVKYLLAGSIVFGLLFTVNYFDLKEESEE